MTITDVDITNIKDAIAEGGDIWQNSLISDFKKRVKEYYRLTEDEQCCYCKKNFHGEFKMVIDIEHILPKGNQLFKKLMFTLSNLNVACKRCNMKIKRTKTDFIHDLDIAIENHLESSNYKFIHPNIDNYFSHIKVYQKIEDDRKLIKYAVQKNSEKGLYTYSYFKLNELEIDSINQAQGIKTKTELSERIDKEMSAKLEHIFDQI